MLGVMIILNIFVLSQTLEIMDNKYSLDGNFQYLGMVGVKNASFNKTITVYSLQFKKVMKFSVNSFAFPYSCVLT